MIPPKLQSMEKLIKRVIIPKESENIITSCLNNETNLITHQRQSSGCKRRNKNVNKREHKLYIFIYIKDKLNIKV